MGQTWYDWLEALVAQFGTAKACATYLEIDESKFSRWRRVYFQEPTALDLERLATRTTTPLPELLLMVHTALKAREALTARPPMGPAASPVVPLRRPAPAAARGKTGTASRRRGKLAAVVFAVASGLALGSPLRVEAARLITRAPHVADSGEISRILSDSHRRRRAA